MARVSLSDCTVISDFKEYIDNVDISHQKIFLKSIIESPNGNLIVNHTSLANKYFEYIKPAILDVELTDKELQKYRYSPKKLSLDLYGTVELWGLILQINNMTSATEFNTKKIKVFTNRIFTLLNEIFILESEKIQDNNKTVKETI